MMEVLPLDGILEIRRGDDLGRILGDALAPMTLRTGDVVVVTQKIVSKAEGCSVELARVAPGARARDIAATMGKDPRLIEVVLAESSEILRADKVLITRHHLGLVMANAGVDCSNTGSGESEIALLLPRDPDGSAAAIADALAERFGVRPGVVISDSFGRPWRHGVVNVAIGCAGVPALQDRRGDRDRDGRILQATQIAYGDLIASAAGLVMGEAEEGIPAALVRGLQLPEQALPASALVRPVEEDLFR
jgi:coenzyme F420-0:L-glutamate ligase/coenzyme F420-1:gamma-L-glutamate ligase